MWKCNAMMFTCFLDMFTIVAIKIISGNGLTPNLLLTKQWAKGELLKPGQGVRRPASERPMQGGWGWICSRGVPMMWAADAGQAGDGSAARHWRCRGSRGGRMDLGRRR